VLTLKGIGCSGYVHGARLHSLLQPLGCLRPPGSHGCPGCPRTVLARRAATDGRDGPRAMPAWGCPGEILDAPGPDGCSRSVPARAGPLQQGTHRHRGERPLRRGCHLGAHGLHLRQGQPLFPGPWGLHLRHASQWAVWSPVPSAKQSAGRQRLVGGGGPSAAHCVHAGTRSVGVLRGAEGPDEAPADTGANPGERFLRSMRRMVMSTRLRRR